LYTQLGLVCRLYTEKIPSIAMPARTSLAEEILVLIGAVAERVRLRAARPGCRGPVGAHRTGSVLNLKFTGLTHNFPVDPAV
jgi:hypothetical protein